MEVNQDECPGDSAPNDVPIPETSNNSPSETDKNVKIRHLNEKRLLKLIAKCKSRNNYSKLARTLKKVFSNIPALSRSFRKKRDSSNEDILRELDYPSLTRAYAALFGLHHELFETSLVRGLIKLAKTVQRVFQSQNQDEYPNHQIVDALFIVFEIPVLATVGFVSRAFPYLCEAVSLTTIDVQAELAQEWSHLDRPSIYRLLENIQYYIDCETICRQTKPNFCVHYESGITAATRLLNVVFYANILAGTAERPQLDYKLLNDELGEKLNVNVMDCREPLITLQDFYINSLNEAINMKIDFTNYQDGQFSFMQYPFILKPETKKIGLMYDNRLRMLTERNASYVESTDNSVESLSLTIRISRERIIDHALAALETVSLNYPNDLKKQLVVEFEDEEGVDHGGVSKEFFQLIVEEIFNLDYGMFTFQNDSQTMWFNPASLVDENVFNLIGIVLGLAIYNNMILSVNFPMVVYRKLMRMPGTFEDLAHVFPTVHKSLNQLLEYSEADIEDVFMQTYRVGYQDIFGNALYRDLVDNGDKIVVNQENKHEFVKLYADFLLNKSIEKEFEAFYRGFHLVVDDTPLLKLFRPDEIELLICGSKKFNFRELEETMNYMNGYTENTPIIKDFWSVVHEFTFEEQKKFLQFTTGSDGVPIGGLINLNIKIARNGPDTDLLPTSHTCFNILLLPEYSSKEKLREKLTTAIKHCTSFGLI